MCPVELITLSLLNAVACWTQDRKRDTRGAAEPEPGPTAVPVWIVCVCVCVCIYIYILCVFRINDAEPATRVIPVAKEPSGIDNTTNGTPPMGQVVDTLPDSRGLVRQVQFRTKTSILRRPITKLALLLVAPVGV